MSRVPQRALGVKDFSSRHAILCSPRQYYCRALCKLSKGLNKWPRACDISRNLSFGNVFCESSPKKFAECVPPQIATTSGSTSIRYRSDTEVSMCNQCWSEVFVIWDSSEFHDDVIKWKHFAHDWPSVWGINRSPVNSPHKGQWRRALMFCAWMIDWVNTREAGHLRCQHVHYDVTVMFICSPATGAPENYTWP